MRICETGFSPRDRRDSGGRERGEWAMLRAVSGDSSGHCRSNWSHIYCVTKMMTLVVSKWTNIVVDDG